MEFQSIAVCIAAAVLYATATFASKRAKEDKEIFAPKKFVRAIVVGVVVGVYAATNDLALTLGNFEQLAQASGAVAIGDQVVKTIWRNVSKLRDS